MSLTETLRQWLSLPAADPWPAVTTNAEQIVQRLIMMACQPDVDAIRLIFERVDGAKRVEETKWDLGPSSPVEKMMRGIHFEEGPPPFDDATAEMHGGNRSPVVLPDATAATIDEGEPISEAQAAAKRYWNDEEIYSPPITEKQAREMLDACTGVWPGWTSS